MRELFTKSAPLPKTNYNDLFFGAEVDRSTAHLLTLFAQLGKGAYQKPQLREDLIKELKALRVKTKVKECDSLHPVFFEEVQKILWDR